MTGLSAIAYAQTRVQSRYGERANAAVWAKLHHIHDLGSYLQTAQQTALRHWVLGLSTSHSSHDIELALRQKYRRHVDEVASWMPTDWQKPLRWIKRLVDLPILQYLAEGGKPLGWMKSDPDIKAFIVDDPLLRLQAIQQAGNRILVGNWQQTGSILSGWLSQWNSMCPKSRYSSQRLQPLEKLLHEQMHQQENRHEVPQPGDYESILYQLRLIFRRSAFQPAAVFAYLAIVAVDLHRIRSDLMQRLYFQSGQDLAEDLPL